MKKPLIFFIVYTRPLVYPCVTRVESDGKEYGWSHIGLTKLFAFKKKFNLKWSEMRIRLTGRPFVFLFFVWRKYADDIPDRISIKSAWELSGIICG